MAAPFSIVKGGPLYSTARRLGVADGPRGLFQMAVILTAITWLPLLVLDLLRASIAGEPTVSRLGASGGDTCHVDVIDAHGNMVSATPSGGWLQSSPAIPELGFCLGTRGQMFWLDESLPNGLKPGKRPRTTLSPAMALKDGRPWMSFGTPGGEQQDQWQPIMFARMVDHAMGIQQAIDAPSFHTEHWISSFWPRPARPGSVALANPG